MKKLFTLLFALTAFVAFQSCEDEDEPEVIANAIINEIDDIDASAYDQWVYFSFETGEIVGTSGLEEERSGLDWDIAFHRWDVRLNCGISGSGQGGALLVEGAIALTGWNSVSEAPTTGYSVDGTVTATKDVSSMPPVQVDVPGSNVITGDSFMGDMSGTWMNMTGYGVYDITNQIFVIKTADGKYAKVWLKQYNNSDGTGHITMKYAYQADGSTKLD